MDRQSSHTTAILIFANSSGAEMQRKKMARGKSLFDALTEHTLAIVEKTGIPFFHINENEQVGGCFGQRFVNAVRLVFDKGYENVIAVGNDSPHLAKTDLLKAISELEKGKSVIGPSADGGFYLMGLHRSSFGESDFERLSWQTSRLQKEIVELLSDASGEIHLLPTLFDLDTFSDIQIISGHLSGLSRKVLEAIRTIVSPNSGKIEFPSPRFIDGSILRIPFNKGSPISSLF